MTTYFHLHLISDSTGETLSTVARAARGRYVNVEAIEHIHPMVRCERTLDRVLEAIDEAPGLVLFTVVEETLATRIEQACRELGLPCLNVLDPVVRLMESYLKAPLAPRVGGQHQLDADYFRRIDALNFVLMHDDGLLPDDLEEADVILIGVSRTSKTPTCIYLANRGVKALNVPVVPGLPLPARLFQVRRPLVAGLVASAERIAQIREHRLLTVASKPPNADYVDRRAIAGEIVFTRKLCSDHGWPVIDVTRRSIEETAAAVLALIRSHRELIAARAME
ncbi:pyruvate, water dikinase regulatory protein [Pseudoxanthobacter sp.]|uniref:pyruvate, water dikinase regulatory protein n=1 Tax=Pseudoxanthobacter sp. TaxID=1925742 RepID=UPI002FE0A311